MISCWRKARWLSSLVNEQLAAQNRYLGRFPLREFLKGALRNAAQAAKGPVSLLRTELQLLCNVLPAFVVAAIWKAPARVFQNDLHVRDSPIIQVTHLHFPKNH